MVPCVEHFVVKARLHRDASEANSYLEEALGARTRDSPQSGWNGTQQRLTASLNLGELRIPAAVHSNRF